MKISMNLIFIVGVFVIFFAIYLPMHETQHQEIFRSYGINSRVEYYSTFPGAVTIAERPCPTEICESSHQNLDNFASIFKPLYFLISLGIFCILNKREK